MSKNYVIQLEALERMIDTFLVENKNKIEFNKANNYDCELLEERRKDLKNYKQALLKAQEQEHNFEGSKEVKIEIPESGLMDYNPVKNHLKWEDLEFKEKRQTIKVRMGNTIYYLFFYEFDTGYKRCHLCNVEETLIYDIQEQFFNDLHLERVE